jgi:hypothetical protein
MNALQKILQTRSKWFWVRSLGAFLVFAPSVVFMSTMILSSTEESPVLGPFVQYMIVAMVALLAGYGLLNRGVEEEEKEKIRAIVREVLNEPQYRTPSIPPIGLPMAEGKSNVSSLPFMDAE